MIHFEETTHTYTLNGEKIPSVTQILTAGKAKFYANNGAADRGTRIHEATALMDTIGLSILEADEDIYGFVKAWQNFIEKNNAKIMLVEKLVVHETEKYAGTLDRLLEINGELYIVDLKSGSPAPWHKAQVAAYARALTNMHPEYKIVGGILVYITEKGRFSQKNYKGVEWDYAELVFTQALRRFNHE